MRFCHLADCHLGGWREPKLQQLNLEAFIYAINRCIEQKLEFVLIAGDLFDTAMPSIDILKEAVAEFRKLKEAKIPCYIVQGSHDYSLSGKSFIDVLEKAGLCINVTNGIETEKLIVYGVPGKKAGLEKNILTELKINLEKNNKVKIFLFHTTLTELKPKELDFIESTGAAVLPDGFDYYAGGHLHTVSELDFNGKTIVYPGPLFPNNIQELEELGEGSFYIIETGAKIQLEKQSIKFKQVLPIKVDLEGKDSKISTHYITNEILKHDTKDKIVILRLKGCLASGKTSDIEFKKINEAIDCFLLLKNTSELITPELKLEINIETKDVNAIEQQLIKDYSENNKEYAEFNGQILQLINALAIEKQEGETNQTFSSRILSEVSKIIDFK
ncbi:DNA repair exonuclease [Candidatus Pacearchaeota archaeon]|nr:DNA repair exonuclease [Candidatus Pacearchaeota archaeon]